MDTQSPLNDSVDAPGIHRHAQLHSLPLTVTHHHTREHALLKHSTRGDETTTGHVHIHAHTQTPADSQQPAQPRQTHADRTTHTHTLAHTHTQTRSPGTLSGFTLSTTEKISASALWLRGRGEKKWKRMYLRAREKGKIPNRAVSLSTPTPTPAPGLSQTRHGRNPSCLPCCSTTSAPYPPSRPRASLVGSGASDELVPSVARGTC